jgi:hypothetical protein
MDTNINEDNLYEITDLLERISKSFPKDSREFELLQISALACTFLLDFHRVAFEEYLTQFKISNELKKGSP